MMVIMTLRVSQKPHGADPVSKVDSAAAREVARMLPPVAGSSSSIRCVPVLCVPPATVAMHIHPEACASLSGCGETRLPSSCRGKSGASCRPLETLNCTQVLCPQGLGHRDHKAEDAVFRRTNLPRLLHPQGLQIQPTGPVLSAGTPLAAGPLVSRGYTPYSVPSWPVVTLWLFCLSCPGHCLGQVLGFPCSASTARPLSPSRSPLESLSVWGTMSMCDLRRPRAAQGGNSACLSLGPESPSFPLPPWEAVSPPEEARLGTVTVRQCFSGSRVPAL